MNQNEAAQIIAHVLKGDKQAYALLVEEYKAPIYNLAYRMTGNQQDAADLTQDVFIRAYTYLWRYNPRKKFFTWLYTIALNTIRNHFKKNSKYKNTQQINDLTIAEQSPSAEAKLTEGSEVNACLSLLDVETRVLVVMKYQQELSFEEIAQITGKSVSAVKMRIYRGLDKLKEMLEK